MTNLIGPRIVEDLVGREKLRQGEGWSPWKEHLHNPSPPPLLSQTVRKNLTWYFWQRSTSPCSSFRPSEDGGSLGPPAGRGPWKLSSQTQTVPGAYFTCYSEIDLSQQLGIHASSPPRRGSDHATTMSREEYARRLASTDYRGGKERTRPVLLFVKRSKNKSFVIYGYKKKGDSHSSRSRDR